MVVVLTLILGIAVVLVTARFTASPALFLPAGLVAVGVCTALGLRWLTRGGFRSRRPSRTVNRVAAAVTVLLVAAAVVAAVIPTAPGLPAAAVADQSYWQLSTGSRIRYVRIPARGQPRPEPVVFLHGGPGTPDMAGDSVYFGQLAADGFDVYVYDEFGSGRSSRARDPEDYTPARDVADLEQIRRAVGAERMNLIGHSYGATLAAGYLARYPQHVARVVFSSPESLDPGDSSGGNLTSRLGQGRLVRLYGRLGQPRNLLVYALLQVNPDAAHHLGGDGEMDARNDAVYALSEPALHCAGHADPHPPTGLGFYRLQYPQSATAAPPPDLRPQLAGNTAPVLVIKGSCDYLSWGSAVSYLETFANSHLVYLNGGHNSYQDVPGAYLATVRAFFTGTDLPVPPRETTRTPPDYQGPA